MAVQCQEYFLPPQKVSYTGILPALKERVCKVASCGYFNIVSSSKVLDVKQATSVMIRQEQLCE